jgi:hypothetical protein
MSDAALALFLWACDSLLFSEIYLGLATNYNHKKEY